jgi:hypothetical protein
MATTVQDPIEEGTHYVVRFVNNVASTGSVLLIVAWVPNHERLVPAPQQTMIAPGASGELSGIAPLAENARRMLIVASLDPGESGRLTRLDNDVIRVIEDATETTTWHSLVVKS